MTFALTAASGTQPFVAGFAFRQGDIPSGSGVAVSGATAQVTTRNAWPDGSLKFAEIAGTAALTNGSWSTITLSAGTSSTGTALTTTDLQAAITQPVTVDAGAFGSATWSGSDWASPFSTWTSGHMMSSWIYRKAVGSDAHLVAWLEVRLFASGAVEILPWIENGYVLVASPTNKSATYTFTMGGTSRFSAAIDLKHHQRTPLLSGSALSHWLGSDPGVSAKHDSAYLQSTELVPSYRAAVAAGATPVLALPGTFTPLQSGSFNYDGDSMASTGYQEPIGLLPQADVLHLVAAEADRAATFAAVIRNGFSAGRYGIHYRDENTNRPLRFSQHPTRVIADGQGFKDNGSSSTSSITPTATGGNPPLWDVAHSPSVGFLAYLLTGRFYFMEEVQFAATCNYLGNGDNSQLRNGAQGLVQPCADAWQTRSCAWDWRARAQALCVTPDADTALRSEFIASVEANIDHFHSRYVAQANNPFGFVQSGTSAYDGGTSTLAPWQQDFVTAAFGYSICLGLPISPTHSTRLAAFFAWTAQSIVGRMSAVGAGFPAINADVYVLSISAAPVPDYVGGTGPWRASWNAVYAAEPAALAAASSPSGWLGTTEGVLCGEIMPGERALWGNLQPAIAYAVRHGVSGASAGYARMVGATNWPELAAGFNGNPVWGIKAPT